MRKLTALLVVAFTASLLAAEARTFAEVMEDVRIAYDAKDYSRLLADWVEADALRPNHPEVLANLAGTYSLLGRGAEAAPIFRRLMAMQVVLDTSDADFNNVRTDPDFVELSARIETLKKSRVAGAEVAYRIPQKDLITEGLAYDRASRCFFVSSARKGTIYRVDRSGRVSLFSSSEIHHGVSGMGIDSSRHFLWACSTASSRNEGHQKDETNDASLVAFNLRNGQVVRRIRSADPAAFFDDLTVAADGTVYVSDSTGSVLRLPPGATELTTLVPRGVMRSPQGSVLSADEKTLYVSDYGGAVRAVRVSTGVVTPLSFPASVAYMGIDGLTRKGNQLIAVQNGIEPNRIVAFKLSADGLHVESARILEMNHPLIDEPTIGKVVDGDYFFLGASAGNKFDKGTPDAASLTDGLIFKIPLK